MRLEIFGNRLDSTERSLLAPLLPISIMLTLGDIGRLLRLLRLLLSVILVAVSDCSVRGVWLSLINPGEPGRSFKDPDGEWVDDPGEPGRSFKDPDGEWVDDPL